MSHLPTRRRVVPTALMALGFGLAVAGSFGITPLSSADTGYTNGITTTTSPSGYESTTTVPETTTTVPETTTTVPETTTTVPETTTTVPETTTTVPGTTTTVAVTTTTKVVPTSVSPATTVKQADTEVLASTGASTSVPMIGLGVSLFVVGLIILEMRANQANA